MPNRILREGILTSDRVDKLSWAAEVFYRRLMSVADDYGRFDGRDAVIRSAAYPLALDRVGKPDIGKWIAECVEAGLVRTYAVDNKPYLELCDFRQQQRSESKYPAPPWENGRSVERGAVKRGGCAAVATQVPSNGKATAHLVGVGGVGEGGGGVGAGAPAPRGGKEKAINGRLSTAEIIKNERELERVMERIKAISDNYDSHQDMIQKHREEVQALKARAEELRGVLGVLV